MDRPWVLCEFFLTTCTLNCFFVCTTFVSLLCSVSVVVLEIGLGLEVTF